VGVLDVAVIATFHPIQRPDSALAFFFSADGRPCLRATMDAASWQRWQGGSRSGGVGA